MWFCSGYEEQEFIWVEYIRNYSTNEYLALTPPSTTLWSKVLSNFNSWWGLWRRIYTGNKGEKKHYPIANLLVISARVLIIFQYLSPFYFVFQVIKDYQLMAIVGILLLVDICVLSGWSIFDVKRVEIINFTTLVSNWQPLLILKILCILVDDAKNK